MKNVIAYCRVSTDNQKEEGTIDLQVEEIKEFCIKRNMNLAKIFKDEGISGGLEDRPALAEMFDFIENKNNEIKSVIIFRLDRLARDLYIQEHLIKKFESLNINLISTKEPDLHSKDPMRKAFRQFSGIVSELEKSFITLRLSSGRFRKARLGGYAGGRVALGYINIDKELQNTPQEAEIIKTIYSLKRNKKLSMGSIAKKLNNENYKTKRGGKWYSSTISYILKNPIYKGVYSYSTIKNIQKNNLALLNA